MRDPQRELTLLSDIPRWHREERPEATALAFGTRTTTWAELDRRSNQVANGLRSLGVEPRDRIAVLARDDDHGVALAFGCAKAGAVLLGLNWRLATPEIHYILEHSEATVLFVGEGLGVDAPDLPSLKHEISLAHADFVPWCERWGDADPLLVQDADDVAVQMYTSGTTGRPKGVMLAHRSFFAVVRSMREQGDPWIGWTPEDVSLLSFPLFHIGGIWWTMTTLIAGARLVVVPSFVAEDALRLIEAHRVTKACMVPAMIQMMLNEAACGDADTSSLTHIIYGGSPITPTCLSTAIQRFGCQFGQIYGLTETGNTAVFLWPEDHQDEDLLRAAGRPYPCVQVKVIDEAGAALGPNAVGEICLRSPANMIGYFKNEAATAATLIDGWVHTGDAGHMDARGYVFVSDRLKDMIISAGENIYPAEIESVIAAFPGVRECAVIGVPDDRWGEVVKAFVVMNPGDALDRTALSRHCRGALADFKVPRAVELIDALPRTPSGKVQKHVLRRPHWDGRDRQVN